MADPLSVAASIAGLASLSDLLFRKLFHYVKSVASAEKEVVDLKKEIALLTGVLHNLVLIARDLEADSTVSYTLRPEHVNSCLALLHRLDDELGKIGIKGPGKISKHLQKLAWPFKNIKVRDYIEDVRQQRDTLNAALNADSFKALLESLSVQKDLSKHIRSVETLLREREKIDTRITLDEERERVLDYFLFVDPQPAFQTSLRLRCATTGFWLTEDETFCQWNNGSCTTLWMSGIPGAGKTVLSGLVIQGCMAKASGNRAVAFFYCDYKILASQKPMHALACLASQIARQSEDSFQILKDYYSRLRPRDQLKQEPEVSELLDIIREMSSTFEDVRIVVDGLDECGDNAGNLTENLLSLCDANGGKTYLALLSRNEADISKAIEKRDHRHIEIAAKSKDLDHYVRSEMELRISTGKLHLRTSKIKDEIIHELVTRAAGMFRWVSCQLDHLCELPTDKERRRALQKLPATLNESYERILLRLQSPSIISLVQNSLRWIAYASPPLSLEQLLDVLSLDEEELRIDDEDRPDPDFIFKHCGSLIRKGQDRPELAHFTVLEYLEAIDPEDSQLRYFRLGVRDRSILASTCVSYLAASNFDRPSLTILDDDGLETFENQYPFHQYAARFDLSKDLDWDQDPEPFDLTTKLFHPKLSFNVYIMIVHRANPSDFPDISRKICDPAFGPLHAAATLGLKQTCQWLLSRGYDVNGESPLGGPLECALFGCTRFADRYGLGDERVDRTAIVRLLLSGGADCEAKSTRENSLSYAALKCHEGIFFDLLKSGMPIHADTLDCLKLNPWMIDNKVVEYEELIKSLEERQIFYQTRLHLLRFIHRGKATAPSQRQPVEVMPDNEFVEAVKFAVQFNHADYFQDLARDHRFMSDEIDIRILAHLAAANDAAGSMQVLMSLCPDAIQGTNDNGKNSWHIASCSGSESVLRLLLDSRNGDCADLQAKCNLGHTSVISAITNRKSSCAMMILDVLKANKAQLDGCEVLNYAVAFGLYEVLVYLKQADFEFTTTDGTGCTALFFMSAYTSREVVELLLERGVHPDRCNKAGMTALHSLLSNPMHQYVSEFTEAARKANRKYVIGADALEKMVTSSSVTIKDNAGHLPWYYFCSTYIPYLVELVPRGSWEVEQLMRLGDLIHVLAKNAACSAYEKSTARPGISLFIKSILDLEDGHKDDNDYQTGLVASLQAIPLLSDSLLSTPMGDSQLIRLTIWAMHKSHPSLVTFLLDMGVDVLVPSHYYNGQSIFDYSCLKSVPLSTMEQVMGKADALELSKPANSSRWASILLQVHHVDKESALEKLDIVLKRGVNPDSIADRTGGATLILQAAQTGFAEAVQLLDRHQADMQYADIDGWDIHAMAVWGRDLALLRLLLTRNALPEYWARRYTEYCGIELDPTSRSDQHVGCNLIHIAAGRSTEDILQILKDTGFFPNLDQGSHEGYTPLHFAAHWGEIRNVKWLISNHVNVNAPATRTRSTPLHIAMAAGNVSHVMALVEAKAQFLPNARGKTPELVAHPESKQELIELLPYCGMDVPPFVLENLRKPPDLFETLASDDLDACRDAINQGVSAIGTFDCGCSALFVAIAICQLSVVELLLVHGATSILDTCGQHYHGPICGLNVAVARGCFNPILRELLQISLNYEDHWIHGNLSPLHVAAAMNSEATDIILDHVATNAQLYGYSLSFVSGYHCDGDVKKRFLEWPMRTRDDTETPDWFVRGGTPLHVALKNENLNSAKRLLQHGADPNALDDFAQTPLHFAACSSSAESIELLMAHNVRERPRDIFLLTPFMKGCREGGTNMWHSMEPSIDACMTDRWGQNALHMVAWEAKIEIFDRLVKLGWDPYLKNIDGDTPVSLATLKGGQIATYVRASIPEAKQILEMSRPGTIYSSCMTNNRNLRHLCRSRSCVGQESFQIDQNDDTFSLSKAAAVGDIERLDILIQAGAELEFVKPYCGTALIMACTVGRLSSIRHLVRRGASIEAVLDGRYINAVQAAGDNQRVIAWLLVGRYTEQPRISSNSFAPDSDQRLRPWAGTRQIEIPLTGRFAKAKGDSLLGLSKRLRAELQIATWRILVPLDWDPLHRMVPFPSDIMAIESKRLQDLYGIST